MSDKPKALLLFSGGFDSTVLLNDLIKQGYDITLYFFNYGQNNLYQETRKVNYWSTKYGLQQITHTLERLPKMTAEDQYVPMRNLIFLAHAAAYAEMWKIPEIYTGFIGLEYYADTSPMFVKAADLLLSVSSGIEFKAPYVYWGKDDVFEYAVKGLGMSYDDLFAMTYTCNTPKPYGDPCGECKDCQAIAGYKEKYPKLLLGFE